MLLNNNFDIPDIPHEDGQLRIDGSKEFTHVQKEQQDLFNSNFKQDIELKKDYARHIQWVTKAWILGVFALMIITASVTPEYRISDSVLITLLTTTTANILTLAIIITKYLFPSKKT